MVHHAKQWLSHAIWEPCVSNDITWIYSFQGDVSFTFLNFYGFHHQKKSGICLASLSSNHPTNPPGSLAINERCNLENTLLGAVPYPIPKTLWVDDCPFPFRCREGGFHQTPRGALHPAWIRVATFEGRWVRRSKGMMRWAGCHI